MTSMARLLALGLAPALTRAACSSPDPRLRPIYHVPADGSAGYVGDPNGLMYRKVPWDSEDPDAPGLFHLFYQCKLPNPTESDDAPCSYSGLYWCHHVPLGAARARRPSSISKTRDRPHRRFDAAARPQRGT